MIRRLGAVRMFRSSGARAATLDELFHLDPRARSSGLDPRGVAAAWGEDDDACLLGHTCFAGVREERVVVDEAARSGRASLSDADLLTDAARIALGGTRRPVLALGGGIDAPLAVVAARRAGFDVRGALTLVVPGTSYDESPEAETLARALDLELHVLRVTPDDLAAALPQASRAAMSAFYNLHPVSRWLVAREAAERGFDALLSGDGADQASRGATEAPDYVPLVASLTRGAGLRFASPFCEDVVIEALATRRDPAKAALRELAGAWNVPASIARRPKTSAWAPPLPRAAFPRADVVAALARELGRPLAWSNDDRRNAGIASLACLVDAYDVALGPSRGAPRASAEA